jgi:hypothetical protein
MDKLTLRVPFSQAERKLGRIGRDGEAIVRQVLFDCRDVLRGWDSASIVCAYWRPEDDAPYLVPLTEVESGVFAFVVRQEDVAKVGTVRMELRRIDGESVLKSATYTATVEKSINASPVDPGSPEEDMLTELGEAAGKANTSAANADTATANANSAAASATTAATNAQNVADTVQKKLDAGELKGEKGDQGIQGIQGVAGADGISPTVTTSKADGVTTVTITDKDGAHTATIEDGADGYSPTATVTKSGTTTTVTVTDKSGTTTAEVKDGSDAAVTKDNIVSALGYEPQEPVGAYELLNTVTTTEAVTSMVINKDSDGKTLNLTHMYVAIYGDGTHTGGASVDVATTAGGAYLYLSGFPLAQTSISSAIWGGVSGHQLTFLHHQYNSGGTPYSYQITRKQFSTAPYITGLSIYSGGKIAAGMTFKIYGVRA